MIPVEEFQAVMPCVPDACRKCGRELPCVDLDPLRHQVWELPEIKPGVTEYLRHRLWCACGCSTCGVLPAAVPTGQAGPRWIAFSGLLMANFRQSKRRAAQFLRLILNQPASAAWMVLLQDRCSEAVRPASTRSLTACARNCGSIARTFGLRVKTEIGVCHCAARGPFLVAFVVRPSAGVVYA